MGSVGGADDPPLGPCFVSRRIRNPICPSIVFPKERERKTRERETVKVKRLDSMLYKASFHCELYCSYKTHWEVLGCALCLLTASAIPRTGPLWGWGFCPGSRRPRARVPLVVWAWDLVVIWLLCCGLPAPARRQFFALRFVTVCHQTYLSLISLSF